MHGAKAKQKETEPNQKKNLLPIFTGVKGIAITLTKKTINNTIQDQEY